MGLPHGKCIFIWSASHSGGVPPGLPKRRFKGFIVAIFARWVKYFRHNFCRLSAVGFPETSPGKWPPQRPSLETFSRWCRHLHTHVLWLDHLWDTMPVPPLLGEASTFRRFELGGEPMAQEVERLLRDCDRVVRVPTQLDAKASTVVDCTQTSEHVCEVDLSLAER